MGAGLSNLADLMIQGNLRNLFTLEIFARMKCSWSLDPLDGLDPVIGLRSQLHILSTEASKSRSGTTRLQNLHIVLSELTPPILSAPLLESFVGLDLVLSRPEFRYLETINIILAISSEGAMEPTSILRARHELEEIEKATCVALSHTVAAHGVQISCDAVNLIMTHDISDFWEIRRNEDGITGESVSVW